MISTNCHGHMEVMLTYWDRSETVLRDYVSTLCKYAFALCVDKHLKKTAVHNTSLTRPSKWFHFFKPLLSMYARCCHSNYRYHFTISKTALWWFFKKNQLIILNDLIPCLHYYHTRITQNFRAFNTIKQIQHETARTFTQKMSNCANHNYWTH